MEHAECAQGERNGTLGPVADITSAAFLKPQLGLGIALAILDKREDVIGQRKWLSVLALRFGSLVFVGQIERAGIFVGPFGVIVAHAVPRNRSLSANRGIGAKA